MPTNYVLFAFSGDHKNANIIKVFISRLTYMDKHETDILHAHETTSNQ
jgi:hypothetical protein